jgi:hypothetical protein
LTAIGFSHSTGFPHSIAVSTSRKWQELGVATKTASTAGDRHKSIADENAFGMLCSRADSLALHISLRDSAVTRQFLDNSNPGISRFAA